MYNNNANDLQTLFSIILLIKLSELKSILFITYYYYFEVFFRAYFLICNILKKNSLFSFIFIPIMKDADKLQCENCLSEFNKHDLDRCCSNCFCCTGCEIYQCPSCKKEIVVTPIGEPSTCRYHNKDNPLKS